MTYSLQIVSAVFLELHPAGQPPGRILNDEEVRILWKPGAFISDDGVRIDVGYGPQNSAEPGSAVGNVFYGCSQLYETIVGLEAIGVGNRKGDGGNTEFDRCIH